MLLSLLLLACGCSQGPPADIHEAVKSGSLKTVESAVDAGADLHTRDEEGKTPLYLATEAGRQDMVRVLLDGGADPEQGMLEEGYDVPPIFSAVDNDAEKVVEALLQGGAAVDARNRYGQTALHLGAVGGRASLVKLLLSHGADVEAKGIHERRALHFAAMRCQTEVAGILLDAGASIQARCDAGQTPLHYAAWTPEVHWEEEKCLEFLDLLIGHGAEVEAQDPHGWRPLHGAALFGNYATIRRLVEHGADPKATDPEGLTAMHYLFAGESAARPHREETATLLISLGLSLDARDNHGRVPLHLAAHDCHVSAAKVLVDLGAESDVRDDEKMSALHWAAVNETHAEEVATYLLALGALPVDQETSTGDTPLHIACFHGHAGAAELFLNHRADIEARNLGKETPLHVAARGDREEVVRLLLSRGADPGAKNVRGQTPYEVATEEGAEVAEFLSPERLQPERQEESLD